MRHGKHQIGSGQRRSDPGQPSTAAARWSAGSTSCIGSSAVAVPMIPLRWGCPVQPGEFPSVLPVWSQSLRAASPAAAGRQARR